MADGWRKWRAKRGCGDEAPKSKREIASKAGGKRKHGGGAQKHPARLNQNRSGSRRQPTPGPRPALPGGPYRTELETKDKKLAHCDRGRWSRFTPACCLPFLHSLDGST